MKTIITEIFVNMKLSFIQTSPTVKEQLYILLGFLAFATLLFITVYLERKLEIRKKEKLRKEKIRLTRETLSIKDLEFFSTMKDTADLQEKKSALLNMQSLEHVI